MREKAGIQAWKATDPSVTADGRQARRRPVLRLARRRRRSAAGIYHYEYAVQNLNNERAGQAFTVPIPPGTVVTNVGFHDVDYHSGEVFDGTDWTRDRDGELRQLGDHDATPSTRMPTRCGGGRSTTSASTPTKRREPPPS